MVVSVLEKIFLGGNRLTYERNQNCIETTSDGDSEFERLEGFFKQVGRLACYLHSISGKLVPYKELLYMHGIHFIHLVL